jgi:hypothetical protein
MGEPHRRAERTAVSGEKPVFVDPEVVAGIKDDFRSKFGREPTSAEVNAEVERLRQFKLTKPEPPQRPSITVAELAAKAKEFGDQQCPPPAPPGPEATMRAEALRMTVRETERKATASAVSDFQTPRARKKRPKKEPTQRSEAVAAMSTWRAEHTRPEFLAAAEVGSIPGVSIKLAPLVAGNKYVVDCENAKDEPKTVDLETIKRWWKEAPKTI